jgi:hypothetical protein
MESRLLARERQGQRGLMDNRVIPWDEDSLPSGWPAHDVPLRGPDPDSQIPEHAIFVRFRLNL